MYRRLTLREGALEDCSLLCRAVAKQMLVISDRHGRIQFSKPLPNAELAEALKLRLGAHRGDRRTLPRLVDELMKAGAWKWKGRYLVASSMVMHPAKREHPAPKEQPGDAEWEGREPVHEPDTSERLLNTNVRLLDTNERLLNTNERLSEDKPMESLNTHDANVSNLDTNLVNNINLNVIGDGVPDVVGDFDLEGWVRASKIVEQVYREATGDLWMSSSRHRGDLISLWEAASKLASERNQTPAQTFEAMVRRWAADPWVQKNGFPFARLAKDPTKFSSKSPDERKRDADAMKYLKDKRYRLLMAGTGEESDAIRKIDAQLRRITG